MTRDLLTGGWDIYRPYVLHPRRPAAPGDCWSGVPRPAARRGFTLMELLVVITIILLVSAVAMPVVIPAYNHREVSAAGRVLQGAIVGARDRAMHLNRPAGVRLLPDPAFPVVHLASGQIDPTAILCYDRVIPIEPAPAYREGRCTPVSPGTIAYLGSVREAFAAPSAVPPTATPASVATSLMVVESPVDPKTGAPNSPTSWFWNVRVGDRIQLNDAGPWYTVVGPLAVWPGAASPSFQGNPEMFVNVGPPGPIGAVSSYCPSIANQPVEFLLLANGVDDNRDGWADSGWDGVDNNGNGVVDDAAEWEREEWLGSIATHTQVDVPYAIRRRPAPSQNAREVALPASMVIDATTWGSTRERSRLPVNPYTGSVDIVVNPDGTVVPTTLYGASSSFGMGSAYYHFWLAERQDLTAPLSATAPSLPVAQAPNGTGLPSGWSSYLKGRYSLLSLNARTGNLTVNADPPFYFDQQIGYNGQQGAYNPNAPFIPAEQGSH